MSGARSRVVESRDRIKDDLRVFGMPELYRNEDAVEIDRWLRQGWSRALPGVLSMWSHDPRIISAERNRYAALKAYGRSTGDVVNLAMPGAARGVWLR
jgi:hypothetical protein